MLRCGLVGYGHWGPNLARVLAAGPDTQLVGICDVAPSARHRATADHPGVAITGHLAELLADDTVTALVVATPAESHASVALDALRAGRHVLVEKPLATSVADVGAVTDAASLADRILMVDHTYAHSDPVDELRRLADAGTISHPFSYRALRTNPGHVDGAVSVSWDLAVHDLAILDLLTHHLPVTVAAEANDGGIPGGSVVEVRLAYPDGSTAHLTAGWGLPDRTRLVVVSSSTSTVTYDDLDQDGKVRVHRPDDGDDPFAHTHHEAPPADEEREPLRRAVEHFAECVANKATPITDGAAARRVAQILEAVDRSIAGGAAVALDAAGPAS